MKYDLIIIGGGSGGFASAIQANELGLKTLLVNSGLPIGGTCVNVGCVPSKTLIHFAKNKNFDFSQAIEKELDLVKELIREKYEEVLKSLENVEFIEGKARFVNENEIEINDQKFQAEKFIIATGFTANVPPIEGIKEVGYLTHISAL